MQCQICAATSTAGNLVSHLRATVWRLGFCSVWRLDYSCRGQVATCRKRLPCHWCLAACGQACGGTALVHCMLSCSKGLRCHKLSSLISVTHLCVHRLSGDSMRDEGSLVGHIGRVCILPEVDCSMVSRPANVSRYALCLLRIMPSQYSQEYGLAHLKLKVVGALLTLSRPWWPGSAQGWICLSAQSSSLHSHP